MAGRPRWQVRCGSILVVLFDVVWCATTARPIWLAFVKMLNVIVFLVFFFVVVGGVFWSCGKEKETSQRLIWAQVVARPHRITRGFRKRIEGLDRNQVVLQHRPTAGGGGEGGGCLFFILTSRFQCKYFFLFSEKSVGASNLNIIGTDLVLDRDWEKNVPSLWLTRAQKRALPHTHRHNHTHTERIRNIPACLFRVKFTTLAYFLWLFTSKTLV